MTDRLWTGAEVPALPDQNDGGAAGITTATTVQFQSAGSVSGVQFRAPNTLSGTWMIAIWEVTAADPPSAGTLLDSKVIVPTAGVWQDAFFNAPIPITPLTKLYRVAIWSSAGRYVATSGVFSVADLTSAGGFIKAYHNGADPIGLGSISQGTFFANAALSYPNSQAGAASYFPGPIFEPAGSDLNITDRPGGASAGSTADTLLIDTVIVDAPGGVTAGSTPQTITNPFDVTIADTSGGVVSGSTADVAVASSALADTSVMPVLLQVMTCLRTELLKVSNPPLNFHIRPGATFSPMPDSKRDECCEGIAWVRPGVMFESSNFPEQLGSPQPPFTSQWAIQVELGVERCIPVVSDAESNDALPTATQWLAATQAAMDDRAALRRAICCIRAVIGKDKVIVGQITPLENEGTCGGEVVVLTIAIQACDC